MGPYSELHEHKGRECKGPKVRAHALHLRKTCMAGALPLLTRILSLGPSCYRWVRLVGSDWSWNRCTLILKCPYHRIYFGKQDLRPSQEGEPYISLVYLAYLYTLPLGRPHIAPLLHSPPEAALNRTRAPSSRAAWAGWQADRELGQGTRGLRGGYTIGASAITKIPATDNATCSILDLEHTLKGCIGNNSSPYTTEVGQLLVVVVV